MVFYNKLLWFVSELPKEDILNVVVQCKWYSTISLSWFVSELAKEDILNVVVQFKWYSTISCCGLCLNYLKKISQT